MIPRAVVAAPGFGQLISWGVTYHLIGGFGEQIAGHLGWSRGYGRFVGRLLAPSFILPAAAALIYAVMIDRAGNVGALYLSAFVAIATLLAAILLQVLFPKADAGHA